MSPAADTDRRECAIAEALDLIGERWALLIVREVFWGNHRFSEIARKTGAPRDILTTRLNSLVERGILERRRYSEKPPRQGYHLTESGWGLRPVLLAIHEWSAENVPGAADLPRYPHHDHQLRAVADWHCAVCGEPIGDGHHDQPTDSRRTTTGLR